MQTDSIAAGSLRHIIHIYGPSAKCGSIKPSITSGGAEVGFTLLFENVPADVAPVRAMEMIRGGQDITQVIVLITIRFMIGVKPNMRVTWQGGNYIIQGIVNEDNRNRKLVLTCLGLGNQT